METPVAYTDATDQLLKSSGIKIEEWPAFVVGIDQAAELFGRMLGKLVQFELAMEVVEIVPGSAGDLIDENSPFVTNVLRADNWDASLLAGASRKAVLDLVEVVFGGDGAADEVPIERDCTAIELGLAEMIFRYLAAALQSSLSSIDDPSLVPGVCKDIAMLDSLGGATEPIILVKLGCTMMGKTIEIFIAFTQQSLLAVGDVLRATVEDPKEQIDPKWSNHFGRQFRRADVKLTAVLDGGDLTLDEVSRLRPGQLLELPSTADSLIKVDCNGQAMLWCRLGQSDGLFVLKVEQFANAEQDFMDELLTANEARI